MPPPTFLRLRIKDATNVSRALASEAAKEQADEDEEEEDNAPLYGISEKSTPMDVDVDDEAMKERIAKTEVLSSERSSGRLLRDSKESSFSCCDCDCDCETDPDPDFFPMGAMATGFVSSSRGVFLPENEK